jgi:uncharacterized protein YhfF
MHCSIRRPSSVDSRGLVNGGELRPFELVDRGTELRRKLVQAVLRGHKTATSSLRQEYHPYTSELLPQVGEQFLPVGYDDEPLGVIETAELPILAAGEVDLHVTKARDSRR